MVAVCMHWYLCIYSLYLCVCLCAQSIRVFLRFRKKSQFKVLSLSMLARVYVLAPCLHVCFFFSPCKRWTHGDQLLCSVLLRNVVKYYVFAWFSLASFNMKHAVFTMLTYRTSITMHLYYNVSKEVGGNDRVDVKICKNMSNNSGKLRYTLFNGPIRCKIH